MMIGRIAGATRVLGKPENWDEARDGACEALAVLDTLSHEGQPVMVSAWLPTPDEVKRMAAGEPVYLWVYGRAHPPVALSVGGE